ncbi:hypothetical protein D3C72_1876840 [compost metagenome]
MGTDQAVHLGIGAHGDEAPATDGHRLGPGVGRVHGVDTAVGQHQVGGAGRTRDIAGTVVGGVTHGSETFFRLHAGLPPVLGKSF